MTSQRTQNITESIKKSFETLTGRGAFSKVRSPKDRDSAFSNFWSQGFPSSKNEFWKYTDLGSHLKLPLRLLEPSDQLPEETESLFSNRLVFVNGVLKLQNSKFDDISVSCLEMGLQEPAEEVSLDSAFRSLNVAFQNDRITVSIPKGVKCSEPLFIDHFAMNSVKIGNGESGLCNTWVDLKVGEGAEVQIIERFFHPNGFNVLSNTSLNVSVAKNARCEHLRTLAGSENGQHFGEALVRQERDSFYSVTTMTAGAAFIRQNYVIEQCGENAESVCNGLYLSDNTEHVDHRVVMKHLAPYGRSRQLYKGVLKGKARTVFNGKIYIEKDAQKIDSNQLNNNLILSRGAEADSKPELEVYADDVKANHGSAIGRLDEDQLFYLMSRCLSRAEAVQYLARGFVRDVSLHLQSHNLREEAEEWIETQFGEFQKSIEEEAGIGGGTRG